MTTSDARDSRDAGYAGDVENGEGRPDGIRRGTVSAHESRPGKVVFTEDGNADGWISTDTTLDVRE
jgi:hypothetical protein